MNQRFILNEREEIIDKLNPGSDPIPVPFFDGILGDDTHLREGVLLRRLYAPVERLLSPSDDPYVRMLEIAYTIYGTIRASHLNTFDPALSIQNRFDNAKT